LRLEQWRHWYSWRRFSLAPSGSFSALVSSKTCVKPGSVHWNTECRGNRFQGSEINIKKGSTNYRVKNCLKRTVTSNDNHIETRTAGKKYIIWALGRKPQNEEYFLSYLRQTRIGPLFCSCSLYDLYHQ
jgi:hypothetical protein